MITARLHSVKGRAAANSIHRHGFSSMIYKLDLMIHGGVLAYQTCTYWVKPFKNEIITDRQTNTQTDATDNITMSHLS